MHFRFFSHNTFLKTTVPFNKDLLDKAIHLKNEMFVQLNNLYLTFSIISSVERSSIEKLMLNY